MIFYKFYKNKICVIVQDNKTWFKVYYWKTSLFLVDIFKTTLVKVMLFMHFSSKYVIQAYVIEIFEYIWSLFLPPKKGRTKILITRMVFAVKMYVCKLSYRCVWVSATLCPTLKKETTIFMWGSVIICSVCVLRGERERSILASSIQGYYMVSAALYPPSRCTGPHLYLAALQPAAVPLVFYPTLAQYTAYRCAMNKHTQTSSQTEKYTYKHTYIT